MFSSADHQAQPAEALSAAPADTAELTPEQQALKKRAERFGLPFNPAAPRTAQKPASKSDAAANGTKPTASSSSTTAPAPAPAAAAPAKSGAIDKTPVGVSAEVLAARAAKFGLPEKKQPAAAPASEGKNGAASTPTVGAGKATPAPKTEVEVTP
jgi:hypothetical protein